MNIKEYLDTKGTVPEKIASPKPHILESNGVWYSLFRSEGPKDHLNLKILVLEFVPLGLRGAPVPGTSRDAFPKYEV